MASDLASSMTGTVAQLERRRRRRLRSELAFAVVAARARLPQTIAESHKPSTNQQGLGDRRDECRIPPMQLVHLYLNFPGTTKEAFQFYETVFGTKIAMIQTFGEASFMPNVPDAAKDKIVHVQLPITEAGHLMGSDVVEGFGPPVVFGNNFHVSVVANDKAEADRVFAALSGDGGSVAMPLANAPWGPYFGMCVDRFGIHWMVSLPTPV